MTEAFRVDRGDTMVEAFGKAECPFCKNRFTPEEARGACGPCGGCLGTKEGACARICPRCGYAVFSPSSQRGNPGHPSASAAFPLPEWPLKRPARVVSLEADEQSLRKLLTLGILPGIQLELERRRPCFLCKVGHSRLALDERLAACVRVAPACAVEGTVFCG